MYLVVFYTQDGHVPSTRTSKPDELVERLIQNCVEKGMWVEPPLFPGYPAEYIVYRNGKRVSSFTVKEIA